LDSNLLFGLKSKRFALEKANAELRKEAKGLK
jgi:hypothetical protein